MNRNVRRLLTLAASLCATVPGWAQNDGVMADLRACQTVPDGQVRLACYDAAMARLTGRPAPVPSARAAPASAEAARVHADGPAGLAQPAAKDADFGLPAPRPTQTPQVIESRVAGRFGGWTPGSRLELANGQVWEVVDSTRASYDLDSPAVRVRRGVLGSFFLEIDGVSATPRVRRLR